MKHALLIILAVVAFTFALVPSATAQTINTPQLDDVCDQPNAANSQFCNDINPTENPAFYWLGVATNILSVIVGVASVIGVVVGGFQLATAGSGGKEGAKIAKARTTIIYSLVGLVVAVLAQVIVSFILTTIRNQGA